MNISILTLIHSPCYQSKTSCQNLFNILKLSDTYTLYIAYHHHTYGVLIWCYCVFCSISQLLSVPSAPHFRDLEVPYSMPAGDFCCTYSVYLK